MNERRGGVGLTRALHAGELPGDDAQQRAAVGGGGKANLAGAQVLVARLGHLELARQVDPELEAVEEAAAHDQVLRWLLDVEDARARSHPLRVTVGDDAATTVRVSVLEDAVDDVGDGLESAVRMPRRALRLTRRVLHLAHLVHHDEGVECAEVDACKGTADGEAFTLEAARCSSDRDDRTILERGIGLRDARQRQWIVDGHGGHGILRAVS